MNLNKGKYSYRILKALNGLLLIVFYNNTNFNKVFAIVQENTFSVMIHSKNEVPINEIYNKLALKKYKFREKKYSKEDFINIYDNLLRKRLQD